MEGSPFALDLDPWTRIIESPLEPGPALAKLREQRDLSRSDVARSMGYRNLSKGCNRLTQWESGHRRPDEHQCAALDAVYQLSGGSVKALWKDADMVDTEHHRQRRTIIEKDLSLLDHYYEILISHRESILARREWRNIRVQAARMSIIWAGGGLLSIGELLEGWSSGSLIHPTKCGRGVPIISANGSALSGLRSVRVLRRDGVELGHRPPCLSVLRALRFPRPTHPPWNLSQLLDALNATVPDLVVRDESGEVVGRYEYDSKTLFHIDGHPFGHLPEPDTPYPTPSSEFCGITIGGRTSTLPVGGLSGGWKRHRFVLSDAWEYREGQLLHEGRIRIRLDGSPPISLLPRLMQFGETL